MAVSRQPRKKKAAPSAAAELRRQAEERLDGLAAAAVSPVPEDIAAVVHDLRVHQIELEMQNEELRRAQLELEAQRAKYFELFDLAPVGYLTLSDESIVGDANFTAARLLGVQRQELVKKPFSAFIFAPDQDVYYRHQRMLEQSGEPQTYELRLRRAGAAAGADAGAEAGHFWARLESRPQSAADGEPLSFWMTFTDVEAQVAAQETLRESEEQYRDLVTEVNDGLYACDAQGVVTFANPTLAAMVGLGHPEQLVGRRFFEFIAPAMVDEVAGHFRRAMESGEPGEVITVEIVRGDGTSARAEVKSALVMEGDRVVGLRGVLRDVSERERAAAALREVEAKYRTVADNTYDWEWWTAPDGSYLYVSPSCERITGYAAAEFVADPGLLLAITHEGDRAALREHLAEAASDDARPHTLEFRIITAAGEERVIEHACLPVYGDDGAYLGQRGNNSDITARKQVEEALAASERRYRTLFDQIPEGVLVFDQDLKIVACNSRMAMITERAPEEFVGKRPEDTGASREALAAVGSAQQGQVASWEGTHERPKSDQKRHLSGIAAPLRGATNEISGVVAVISDVTERKQAEEELRRSEARLVAAQAVAKVGSWETDLADLTVIWSAETYRVFEVDPASFGASHPSFLTYVHPEDREKVDAAFAESLDSPSLNAIEHRIITPGGLVKSVEERWRIVRDDQGRPVRAVGTCQDITERMRAEEEIHRQAEQLRRALEGTVLAMSQVVESRDPYTAGHERHVAELATAIAAQMGIDGEALEALRHAAFIHDVGKVAVPADILAKPGRLSAVEFELIKQHPAAGFEILTTIDFGRPVAEIVLQHHERLDGSGYPQGLAGADTLPEAKILAVADVVEAMSSHRPYRAALGMEAALAEIRAQAGVKYDAEVVAACLRLVAEQGFAFSG